uniref:MADS-box domain-containing protein n=1 Tax=Macrostomum lignano TaxID=282301 RepID=A0A1I8FSU7_9PLAT
MTKKVFQQRKARSLFKDHHVLLIVKRRNGRNTKSCASPEVLPLLHSNDANGLLQQFELLSSQEPSGNGVSTRKPTVDEMRKEVRAEARAAYRHENGQEDNDHNVQASGGTAEHAQDESESMTLDFSVPNPPTVLNPPTVPNPPTAGFSTDDVEVVF